MHPFYIGRIIAKAKVLIFDPGYLFIIQDGFTV